MKKLLLILLLSLNSMLGLGQTVVQYDYMETWNWPGYWAFTTPVTPVGGVLFLAGGASGWATNASVSSNESARIYGTGNGSSAIEQNWYILPNITGLDPNKLYQFRFRLASYRFSSTNTTRGVDTDDFVEVQISTDGELTYTSELRIAGNNNAYWDYNTNGIIVHSANGIFNTALNTLGGDVYRSGAGNQQAVGYSLISLDLPLNISQIAVDILCRVNSAGEEWWLDNIELVEIDPMPIELMSFEGVNLESYNLLTWSSASEYDNDYYLLERSIDGYEWSVIDNQKGIGNSNTQTDYSFRDFTYEPTINYYRLSQVDFNGNSETFNVIAISNLGKEKQILFLTNILGQIVGDEATGILIVHYSDGTSEKIYK